MRLTAPEFCLKTIEHKSELSSLLQALEIPHDLRQLCFYSKILEVLKLSSANALSPL